MEFMSYYVISGVNLNLFGFPQFNFADFWLVFMEMQHF